MVDINKLHTPSGYARLIGHSRANVYNIINGDKFPSENVFDVDGQQLILEDGKEGERREKNQYASKEEDVNK